MPAGGLEPINDRVEPAASERLKGSVGKSAEEMNLTVLRRRRRTYAAAVPRLLADERTRTIVRALADGSRRPSELETLQGIVRSTMYARLNELTALGVVATERITEFPLRVAYRLNDAARPVLAHELLIVRRERRTLARLGPGAEASLSNVLRLLAPISRMPDDSSATCVLAEHEPPEDVHAVRLLVENKRIALSDIPNSTLADARVQVAPEDWDDALLAGPPSKFQVRGDESLARTVVTALGAPLRRV